MNPNRSLKALRFGYVVIALLWLAILVNNAISNFTGNRTIIALVMFSYLVVMCYGLQKWKVAFSFVSLINFIVGLALVGWFLILGLPALNSYLLLAFIAGIAGLFLSISSTRIGYEL